MDVEIGGTRPLDFMIPKFLTLSEHPNAKMRAHAIACLSYFVPINSQSLFAHIDNFIATLFKRASDDDSSVRRHVCQSLVLLLASKPDKLMPEMNNVAEYMLFSTRDRNETVALEACEFWLTFAEEEELSRSMQPLLPKVGPVLLECMVYGEDDLLWLDGDADDSAVPDKDSDINLVITDKNRMDMNEKRREKPQRSNRKLELMVMNSGMTMRRTTMIMMLMNSTTRCPRNGICANAQLPHSMFLLCDLGPISSTCC